MAKQRIAITLASGFLAFAFSTLSVTTAEAKCQWIRNSCPSDWTDTGEVKKIERGGAGLGLGGHENYTRCCTTPSNPYATGETATERAARFDCEGQGKQYDPATGSCNKRPRQVKSMKKIKGMGPGSQSGKEALRNACNSQNWVWNEETGRCKRPSRAKAECEARGSKFRYNLDTGRCVKHVSMSGEQDPSDSDKAECRARGRKFRYDPDTGRCVKHVGMSKDQGSSGQEFEDEDFQPKKKKKKPKPRLDVDVDIF